MCAQSKPGESFHLITRKQYEDLPSETLPEIMRLPLENVILSCKLVASEKAESFLKKMLQPLESEKITEVVSELTKMRALDSEENLTALGRQLAILSMYPKLGKALILSEIFE